MRATPESRRHDTILRLLRIANISRDLDRSRDDSQYAATKGKIVYVLDENVFEMFIKPFEHARNVETFYAQEWGSMRVDLSVRRRYEAQSALIASEHLIIGKLAGNADDCLYMTEPHRWELFSRLSDLTEEMRDSLSNKEVMLGELQAKLIALRGLTDQNAVIQGLASYLNKTLAEDLETDINALKAKRDVPLAFNRIRATRIAAEILANNKIAEPLDQLQRLTSQAVRGRIRDLQDRVACPADARRAIDIDSKFWLGELQKELALPANRRRKRAQEKPSSRGGALNNDALTIAYLRWAARELAKSGERLVFVTGDDVVFDTYRRWYSDPKMDVPAEPFFMRRVAQYSPIFIPTESGGDLSKEEYLPFGQHAIFDRVQEAIESTLLPIVLAEQSDNPEQPIDGVYPKSRERLALKFEAMKATPEAPDLVAFASKLDNEFLRTQRETLKAIRERWQLAQRLIIGASYDLLAARLTPEQRQLANNLGDLADQQAATVLSEYATKILASIVEESVQLWFPLAKEFLAGRGRDQSASAPSFKRLWPALNLREQFTRLDFEKAPELVFAEAACSAIAIQDPSNGCRFARLAIRAEAASSDKTPGLREELRYLSSIACRLLISTIDLSAKQSRLGTDDPIAFQRSLTQIKELYSEASGHIHSLAAHHDAMSDEAQRDDTRESHKLRYLRALSERASLNLFMATALGLARDNLAIADNEVNRYLELARGDLKLCALRDKIITQRELETELITAIRSQYAPNVAAYEVLAFVLDTENAYRPQIWPKAVHTHLRTFNEANPSPHPLLRAELVGFALIMGNSQKALSAKDYVYGTARLRLALDKTLFRKIYANIFKVDTGKAMAMSRERPGS